MKTIEKFLAHLYSLDVKLWIEDANLRCSVPEDVLTDELGVELRSRKSEIINFLRQAKSSTNYTQAILPAERHENLPLSFAQQRLWFLEQLQLGNATYNLPTAVRLKGNLDVRVLERSLNEIIQRHEVLRTHFKTVNGNPVLHIQPSVTLPLAVIDLQTFNPLEQDEEVRHLALKEAQTPFDLATDVLLRVKIIRLAKDENVVLFTMHHIISDGWSMEILIKELATLYNAFSTNQPSPLPELAIQYVDFAVWQRQWLQGEVLDTQLDYWRQQLGGILPVLQLPTDYPRGRVQTFRGAIESFSLSPQLSQDIIKIAKSAGVTPFVTLLTAYKILLHRYTGQTDILVGTPVANRHRREIEGLIGFFVNTLVLRTNLTDNPSFQDLLQQLKNTTWQAYDHQDIPFEKLVEVLQPERDLSFNPLFQVKFRLENAPTEKLELPGLTLTPLNRTEASAKLDLSLDMYETSTGFVGAFEYNRDLFAPETISRMVGHFQTLLTAIVENPEKRTSELPLLTESERQKILIDWNQTQVEFPSHLTFQDLFAAQVEKTPDAVAVIFDNQSLTYKELNQKSNQVAHYLQQKGVKPEIIVGLCVERTPLMIIALLGILKAGGAYLPLDPNYPPERLGYMLADSQVPILLTEANLKFSTPQNYEIIYLDTDWEIIYQCSIENPESEVTPENLAYLIYTSGSTGKPKGVLIPHIGLTNLTKHKIEICDVHPGDCVLQFFSLSFDASIPEIIMALGSGAKLCLAKSESLLPGETLLQLLQNNAVTHITITPSALSLLPSADLPHLRMILVGGEAPSPELIAKWSEGRRFINAYGPTEVTVNASMVLCGNGHPLLPTIRPSANKQLYILDNYLQPVPIGVIGELYIGGLGLARGYLNRPDLTNQKFIPNPFSQLSVISYQLSVNSQPRLYKTGDLACYLPDGRIKLLGRIDNQVKIRGFRIEPQEVETVLCQHSGVRAGVVIVREDQPNQKRLVAYVVANEEAKEQGRENLLSSQSLRSFMREKLPEYLVPSAFVLLENLPLTPNGKVDIHSLPAPEEIVSTSEFIAPRTQIEAQLANIYTQILNLEKVSIHDDFFELGGHSLIATQLISQALQVFQVELTVMDLFDAPTVAGMAERILQRQLTAEVSVISDTGDDEREEFEI
ncbi:MULTISPECIES: amino acid adenylation domain-containing protein [Cyanophyceae]|uniref:non-ribosomal peptide synthetase n=1 Tax=Cyanophyceae TaxID=3028117 RepID=UPI00232F7FDB|nr:MULTISPECIES: amino acid adenylation domain-containing protein [Cyanophyceae]MDB9358400.1 amino acid adenylation domain-containing protein [Nodularia spumigena CS-587/03]MDB9316588.1 amino acid adenylation domain-containing protein [Nodularia spumigena CS-590/01A]MDB9324169.1 amino acid adenylation domain-containing protein [Nodularia spumigena CS-591/07A]MDB9325413.1 amino acid adenylation domain-containing protein [Nodularia spumigena CS-590/02]MDB9331669.1 amino acid adenylation domain-c